MTGPALKGDIRAHMKARRRALSVDQRRDAAALVLQKLNNLDAFTKASSFFCYLSARRELGTKTLVQSLLAQNKTVLVPFTLPDGVMVPRVLRCLEDQVPGAFNIPTSKGPEFAGSPDVCLVPALAFDSAGNRVGYGGGYYDRFLAQHPTSIRIGLGYDFQLIDTVPAIATDIPLHHLVTPSHALQFDR